ncbi:phosphate/phosphite/phosphonate ABC transporter substrate-binding protein [Falsiroseomonas oryziterrae]|uniref:phosphate/phosphite/phosphonate ABC transporter substrate-binding protein n=1 Tax=Falsiroseomonas oryziterrae TaxID=2911368 RepID=UPI001F023EB8|nr:phosphate/phosphite/phosphonate ABC transporter substrate-binding protein [Roseomonas sp. NPKOSM-4]
MLTRRHLAALLAAAPFAPALAQTAPQSHPMPQAGRRAWANEVREIRVGLLGGENEGDRLARFGAYRALIERHFQVPTRIFPAGDYAGVLQGFAARQLEIAGLGPVGYARIWLDTNGNIEPIVITQEADGSISYVAVMYVRADSGITSLEQMRGRSLAWADPNSTSGFLVPRSELREAGINVDQFFGRTGFAGGHEQGVVAVLNRQFDGGVTWASGIGEESQGFTRGNLRAMVDKNMLNMRDIRIIWRSRPIPNGPMGIRLDLPQAFRDDMRAFHMALPSAEPEIFRQIERGVVAGYAPGRHDVYQPIIDMVRAEAAARRQRS